MSDAMTPSAIPAMPASVAWLGYGGLIPFIVLALAAALDATPALHTGAVLHATAMFALGTRALFAYGAVILSFVGALHWAFAMTLHDLPAARRNTAFAWSVVPALLAFVALVLPPPIGAALLILGFLAQYGQDVALTRVANLPAWYLPLRLPMPRVGRRRRARSPIGSGRCRQRHFHGERGALSRDAGQYGRHRQKLRRA
jgi:hypothetical protein